MRRRVVGRRPRWTAAVALAIVLAAWTATPGGAREPSGRFSIATLVACVLPSPAPEPAAEPHAGVAAPPRCDALGPDRAHAAWISEC